jgi:hypothetical protein
MSAFRKIALCLVAALAFGAGDDLLAKTKSRKPAPPAQSAVPVSTPVGASASNNPYPDHGLTPGMADTQSVKDIQARWPCPHGAKAGKDGKCTYSTAHRNVPTATKNAVYAAYEKLYPGLTAYCHALDQPAAKRKAFTVGKGQRCEVDHFCPVGIGCSNDAKNLWIQRADTIYNGQLMGFHQKDDLEAWGIAQVKAGKLDPKDFDTRIWADWVAYYYQVRPPHSNVSN